MKVEFTKSPLPEDVDFLTQKINEENSQTALVYPFAFFTKDDEKNIIAGVNGFVIFGAMYIDQLWVDPKYRRRGMAKDLMERVHAFGKEEGCGFVTLQTMDFQEAVGFYKKLGYTQEFKKSGYVGGSSCLFMQKLLE